VSRPGDTCTRGGAGIYYKEERSRRRGERGGENTRAPETREMMGGDPVKLVKSVKGAAQKYLGVGFLLGFFLVLLTYFTVSEQFAISAPNGE
jgi:hypothetical protein